MSLSPNFVQAVCYLYPTAVIGKDVVLQDDGAGPYLKAWNLPGSPPTDQQIADAVALVPAAQLTAKRTDAKAILDTDTKQGRLQRALVLRLAASLNDARQWITAYKAAVAAAASMADLKTRVAALPDLPDLTPQQIVTAIKNAIDQEN